MLNPKEQLRQEMKALRLAEYEKFTEASMQVCHHFFTAVSIKPTDKVAAYFPLEAELDCLPILEKLLEMNIETFIPVIRGEGRTMVFGRWQYGDPVEFYKDYIPVPFGTVKCDVPDIILAPVLGFDKNRNRLGYGGGYYDRAIAGLKSEKNVKFIGLGYSFQELNAVPSEPHDVPLDMMITDKGIVF